MELEGEAYHDGRFPDSQFSSRDKGSRYNINVWWAKRKESAQAPSPKPLYRSRSSGALVTRPLASSAGYPQRVHKKRTYPPRS